MKISQRASKTPASAIRKLVPFADAAKRRGIKVYHLNIGQPDLPTPPEIIRRIRNFREKTLEYAPSSGMFEAVTAWRKFYADKGVDFETKDIIVTSGGSEGLMFAFLGIADPGDEILVFEPFYTSYAIMAAMGNIQLKPVATRVETGFHLPAKKEIVKAIGARTKGIILCNPNNPTGTLYAPEEVKMIADIANEYNLFIISDETYQEIVFDGKKVLPFAAFRNLDDRLIICDSVSKRFNSCGARVGCVISRNEELMQAILRFGQGRLSVATVEQLALIPMLANHKKYAEFIRKTYQSRRNTVVKYLKKIKGVTAVTPEGAFYIIPKLPIRDSDDFAAYLLNEFSDKKETLMIAPATGFYATAGLGKDEIRIAYVLEEKKLERAMELLGLALERYKIKSKIKNTKLKIK